MMSNLAIVGFTLYFKVKTIPILAKSAGSVENFAKSKWCKELPTVRCGLNLLPFKINEMMSLFSKLYTYIASE